MLCRLSISLFFVYSVNILHPLYCFCQECLHNKIEGKIHKMKFSKFLEFKYLEWQQNVGRKTVKEFAAYIGVSTSTISTWWNEDRVPEGENIQKLASKLGIEVYDSLDLPRPDPDLLYIQQNWSNTVHHLLTTLCETIILNPKTMKMKVRFR